MIMRRIVLFLACLTIAGTSNACAAAYDPRPWLDDLSQMRLAFSTKYANFEWAVFVQEIDVAGLFADARKRIETGSSDADARAAFERLVRRLNDGHVEIHWPAHATAGSPNAAGAACAHFDTARAAKPLVSLAAGYVPLVTPQSDIFPAGVIVSGTHRVGVIKIAAFDVFSTPQLCSAAMAALAISPTSPCDDACSGKIEDWAEARMNEDFIAQIKALQGAKIDTLLVDIAGNGGGTEWADAAARMLTSIRLRSPRIGFMRGAHWAKKFGALEASLSESAKAASPADRGMLLAFADQAAAKKKIAETPCDAAPLWEGRHPDCAWLGAGFYTTGLLDSADPETLRGRPWAPFAFIPMEYQYTEGLWRGPLIVVVDGNSGSSSERFAAELQDNHAALIMGEPTYGAIGGHTDGGTPTTLSNSGATLIVPDGSDLPTDDGKAPGGVVPEVLVGFRRTDGPHLRVAAFLEKLLEALFRLDHPTSP
jgi:hypothetical protein